MFVQDFIVVDRPCPDVAETVVARAAEILGASTGEASDRGASLLAKVGPGHTPEVLRRTVELSVGPVRHNADTTLIALSWEADGTLGALFPNFDADLEVAPLGPGMTELSLRGRYDPPGGRIGRSIDRAVLHRIAESTVRALLESVAARLERSTPRAADAPERRATGPARSGPGGPELTTDSHAPLPGATGPAGAGR
ncbi:MAG: hypothetical protein M0T80_14010 [Actinomycetota bacterium]|nr:hypothetical protein [Actinomycetota bacterium]